MKRVFKIVAMAGIALMTIAGGALFCSMTAAFKTSPAPPTVVVLLPTTPAGPVSGIIDRTRVALGQPAPKTETPAPGALPTTSGRLIAGVARKKTTTPINISLPSATPNPSLSATFTRTATQGSPTVTKTPSLTRTPSRTPTITNTPTKTLTPTITFTPSKTLTPSNTFTPSKTFTPSNTFTPSKTFTPSNTFTPSRTFTATNTKTNTPTRTPTRTPTATYTRTPTWTNTATRTPTFTYTPTNTRTPTFTPSVTPTATATSTSTNTSPAPTATFTSTATSTFTSTFTPTATVTPTATTAIPSSILEPFENAPGSWQTFSDLSGTGSVTQSSAPVAAGSFAARAATSGSGSTAKVRFNFSDSSGSHSWEERPGTFYWQWANVYLPSSTVAQLGAGEYLTIAGLWPSAQASQGWFLRVRQGGELYVVGNRDWDNSQIEFRVYGTFPQDQWVDLEIGLHSQSGPGVKRAFSFLINGNFYGWYHQGRMSETYDRAAMGILATNSNDPLEVFVDQWRYATSAGLPGGPDNRSTANLQEQDYRTQSGAQWQIDWTTWEYDLRLDPQYGLYSNTNRLQSGRNIDRMPDLTSGWAEIEIDWPKGTPNGSPSSYFGPMVGFRKEINREENFEIIPIGYGGGNVRLAFEAWVGTPVILAEWQMPLNASGTSRIPEPGDIIRVRWEQVNATDLNVRASYYDASTGAWHNNVISMTLNITSVDDVGNASTNPVNYTDGYHTASSVTTDSSAYSIRRFKVGTLDTYPGP